MAQALALQTGARSSHLLPSNSPDRWGDLMSAAQSGNGGAYNRLLTELSAWLQRYYARRIPAGQVDDLVQEALVAVHIKRHTYEAGRPFRAWLAGIARYKWIDRLRSNRRHQFEPIEDHHPAVDDHASAVGSKLAVVGLLNRLKPAQASVIRLVKLDGLSLEEAVEATGQSVSLVKVNIHRGIARLSAYMGATEERA